MVRLKGKFTQRWLSASEEYYYPLWSRLFYAQFHYLQNKGIEVDVEDYADDSFEEALVKLEAKGGEYRAMYFLQFGLDDVIDIASSIDSLNRGFIKLLEAAEPLAAMALVRLQLDNLTYLAAELKYPFRILYKVFYKGKRLSQIQVQGKNLNPSAIRKELDEQNNWNVSELYDRYPSFIHPDKVQLELRPSSYYSYKEGKNVLTKAEIKNLCSDMMAINRMMAVLIQCQIFSYNSGLKD